MSKTEFSPILRTRSAIATTAIKNGQLLASTDTGECFVDANNVRVQIGDVIKVPSAEALPIAPVAKIYFSEADLCFYYPTYENGNLVWKSIGGATDTPASDTDFFVRVSGETLYIMQESVAGASAITDVSVTGETLVFTGAAPEGGTREAESIAIDNWIDTIASLKDRFSLFRSDTRQNVTQE